MPSGKSHTAELQTTSIMVASTRALRHCNTLVYYKLPDLFAIFICSLLKQRQKTKKKGKKCLGFILVHNMRVADRLSRSVVGVRDDKEQ